MQFKNWLMVLSVYVITLSSQYIVPDFGNPIVESTVIVELPTPIVLILRVLPVIVKVPVTVGDESS